MSASRHVVCPYCLAVNRVAGEKLESAPLCGVCKRGLFRGEPTEVDAAAFSKHITRNDIPVVVDFWAPWCGPCRTMAPAFAEAARRLEPQVRAIKLNTEEAGALSAQYGIRSIPTLAVFTGGREVARQAGTMDAARIVQWVYQHL